ncbi:type I-C CRISPR-associated protein Cas8c/Csd1 [Nocardia lijiangensis]|uniref:type I-C CRISPR-associated protein Cas8c/Csd1 n=1 Tax=Nocardia lijiangensis TaxID=299618 RepID=UPI00082DBB76|nr:type I-C CRISPR-associated protein Cas8c/Csd1 [Nocardia lijiangensis]
MLLERLAAYANDHRGAVAPFHRDREFRWSLDIQTDGGVGVRAVSLLPLRDVDKPLRGVVHTVPAATRTVGVSANLAADDAQYVLGRGDEKTHPSRVAQCHAAYADLIRAWAESVAYEEDRIPHVLAAFYRDGGCERVPEVEGLQAKDGVLTTVDGGLAHRSTSAARFWCDRVASTKGSGRSGLCLVCRLEAPLANTIPGKVPASLVPGASNDAALVSINERSFGYDLTTQLTHTPICMTCADDVMVGLTGALSSEHTRAYSGQDTRLAWWTTGTSESDYMSLVFQPDPQDVNELFRSLHTGSPPASERLAGRFCWLAVGGHVARIMVREWVDMPLAADDPDIVNHDANIAAWFADHEIVPRRREAFTLPDGTQVPAGRRWHSVGAMAASLGRWDPDRNRYLPFVGKNSKNSGPNPDRPDSAMRHMLDVAVLNRPVPTAIRAHLIHRVCSDGRVDDVRAALIRLSATRSPDRRRTMSVPMGLDESCTDPSYVAGRLFAVFEQVQRAAHQPPRKKGDNSEDTGDENSRTSLNSTYADKYFRSAVTSPRPALIQGHRLSSAWLSKIRRRDGDGLAHWHKQRVEQLCQILEWPIGCPLRNGLRQQEWFVLGYYHQLGHSSSKSDN